MNNDSSLMDDRDPFELMRESIAHVEAVSGEQKMLISLAEETIALAEDKYRIADFRAALRKVWIAGRLISQHSEMTAYRKGIRDAPKLLAERGRNGQAKELKRAWLLCCAVVPGFIEKLAHVQIKYLRDNHPAALGKLKAASIETYIREFRDEGEKNRHRAELNRLRTLLSLPRI